MRKTAYPGQERHRRSRRTTTVIYNNIIKTMDVVLSAKFPDIGLRDKGGGDVACRDGKAQA